MPFAVLYFTLKNRSAACGAEQCVITQVQPLSDFRAGAASFIPQVNETRRPIVITQRGKGVAVILDVAEYESMQEKIELLEEIQTAESQLSLGLGISNSDARAQIF